VCFKGLLLCLLFLKENIYRKKKKEKRKEKQDDGPVWRDTSISGTWRTLHPFIKSD
jgi:hypothetical protein